MTNVSNYLNIDKAQNQSNQLWSITNTNFEHNNQERELSYHKKSYRENCEMSFNRGDTKMENSFNLKNSTKKTNRLQSFYSIVERLRHFLHINLLLNKYTVIFSLVGYLSDLFLFVSLNLFIFSNKFFLFEFKSIENQTNLNKSFLDNNSLILKSNLSDLMKTKATRTIKQSYLTLQILVVFVFFICFILSYLIKFQFKYHRWAISLYDYDIEITKEQEKDTVDRDSLASTTTASQFSSSNSKKLYSIFKKILNRLFTKLASIILNFLFGYQFCQNCFIEKPNQIAQDSYSIFIHFFIFICVLFRCIIGFLKKKYSINFGKNLKKLQEKALYDSKCNLNKNYYFNYYSYLMKYNQDQCNQLKQHQNNKNNFRIFQLDDMSLFSGFIISLFHLFNILKSVELTFVFAPLLLTLILFRLKSILNASFNLGIFLLSVLFISKMNTYTITDISEFIRHNTSMDTSITNTSFFDLLILKAQIGDNQSSFINLLSFNILTFSGFLLTLYFKSIVNIYYCTLNSLERWNISFMCKMSFWHKLVIYSSYLVYFLFSITCSITLLIRFKSWSFLIFPVYLFFVFLWCSFQVLSMINLSHLMNKIADCYLLLNETNSLSNTNSFENSSNISRKSAKSVNQIALNQLATNRDSILTQSTSSNNNQNQNNNSSENKFFLRIRKYIIRLLKYKNLTNKSLSNLNVPIHRILSYKGVRHLGSISYRITLYCFIQTLLLVIFVFSTNSPLTIGLYLITLSINFIWLSLLYLFPKSSTGTCIAYALVAPPLILNIYNAGTLSTTLSCVSNSILINDTKKTKTNSNTSSAATYSSNLNSAIKPNTFMSLPFNYQQALTERCTYILNRIQAFLQFHLIENYGCDFVSTGLSKELLEQRLRLYFQKCSNDGSYYNTYILYYCGPTSILTDSLTFIDGNELSIEQIVKIWKDIHCNNEQMNDLTNAPNNQQELNNIVTNSRMNKNSRLILILDAENTNKSLHYIKTKLNEPNVYVALQTVKYNYNFHKFNLSKNAKNSETKLILKNRKKIKTMAPGSPQFISGSYFDSYLNIGKFTLDWIKSNCNAANLTSQDADNLNRLEYFLNNNQNFDESIRIHDEKESDENDDDDDDDYDQDEYNDVDYDSVDFNENKKNNNKSQERNASDAFFYEAKCAFSKHWTNYTYDSSDTSLASDLNHFWNIYYPYVICRPMLKLINCRIFYLKIDFIKKIYFLSKKLKEKVIPVHEYDTGHGFKLFTS